EPSPWPANLAVRRPLVYEALEPAALRLGRELLDLLEEHLLAALEDRVLVLFPAEIAHVDGDVGLDADALEGLALGHGAHVLRGVLEHGAVEELLELAA